MICPSRVNLRTLLLPIVVAMAITLPAVRVWAIGPDAYGYTAAAMTVDFEDLTDADHNGIGVLDNSDDDTIAVPIGFSFIFYGVAYDTLYISSNGMITFGAADNDWVPVDFTTTATTGDHPSIAPFFHDLTFQYLGSDEVYYQTLGAPGGRRLVVQWNAAQSATGPGSDTVTFEVKLFEGSNNIEFHYDDVTITDDSTNSNGRLTTVGIRDQAGQTTNRVLQWLFNKSTLVDDTAIRYVAPVFKVNSIAHLTNKHVLLQCTGAPSTVNKIEASTVGPTGFTFLGSSAADSTGHFTYEDAGTTTLTKRFYRVMVP
jgi:hypothetical protein